jgi:hypothetical protein
MKRISVCLAMAIALQVAAGCDTISRILAPTTVSVSLVNNGDFEVQARLFMSDNQDVPEDLLTELGESRNDTIAAGDTTSFTRDCDDLQAIIVEHAELRVLGGLGPTTSSDVLRDGTDFGCGDRVTFTFDHSAVVVDFDVTVAVTGR